MMNIDILKTQEGADTSGDQKISDFRAMLEEKGISNLINQQIFKNWICKKLHELGVPHLISKIILRLISKLLKHTIDDKLNNSARRVFDKLLQFKIFKKAIIPILEDFETTQLGNTSDIAHEIVDDIAELKDWVAKNRDNLGTFGQEINSIISYLQATQPSFSISQSLIRAYDDTFSWLFVTSENIKFSGRENELQSLDEFADDDRDFAIWMVTGPSGAGKTRLMYHWMQKNNVRHGGDWKVGFVSPTDKENWQTFYPSQPTFLVIDYFNLAADTAQTIIKRCQHLENDDELLFPVRLLIIDHIFVYDNMLTDDSWKNIGSNEQKEQFSRSLFRKDALNLPEEDQSLPGMLVSIVSQIAEKDEHHPDVQDGLYWLYNTEGAAHPLFAALIGDAIKRGKTESYISRRGLIKKALEGSDRVPWQNEHGGIIASGYVCAATLLGGAKYNFLHQTRLENEISISKRTVKSLAKRIVASDNDPEFLDAILPDIFGETFLLLLLSDEDIEEDKKHKILSVIFANPDNQTYINGNILEFCRRCTLNLSNDGGDDQQYKDTWMRYFTERLTLKYYDVNNFSFETAGIIITMISNAFSEVGDKKNAKKTLEIFSFSQIHMFINVQTLIHSAIRSDNIAWFEKVSMESNVNLREPIRNDEGSLVSVASYYGSKNVVEHFIKMGVDVNLAEGNGGTALHLASQDGHLDIVKLLISAGADINKAANENGATAVLLASQGGHADVVELLISTGMDVNQTSGANATAVMMASQHGYSDVVKLLLAAKANVNQTTNDGTTALMLASLNGHVSVVVLLIEAGVDINQASNDGATALMVASQHGHADVIKLLIAENANVNLAADYGVKALILASLPGHADVVELLIAEVDDIDQARDDGVTALFQASKGGNANVVKLLIDAGADINRITTDGRAALMIASNEGYADVVALLIDAGANISQARGDGATALMVASQEGRVDVVKLLIEATADVNDITKHGTSAILIASIQGHTDVVDLLIKAGADVNKAAKNREAALLVASREGHTSVVDLLIEAGADVNKAAKNHETALLVASREGHTSVVDLLIKAGADVNKARDGAATALHFASHDGHTDIVELLIAAKTDVNQIRGDGATAIILASGDGHANIVKSLIGANANINATALTMASQNGHINVVELLISAGIDVNQARGEDGVTALMMASLEGHATVVKLLIAAEADVNQATKDDTTALSLASLNNHTDVVKLLKKNGAK